MTDRTERPPLIALDVNETLSDLAPLLTAFTEEGLSGDTARTWFAGVLRDGFALAATGQPASFADIAKEALGGLVDPAAAERLMSTFMDLPVHPDVPDGLRRLSDSGIRLVTLTNGAAAVGKGLLTRAGLVDLVERFLSVDDVGIWKPAERAYRHALTTCDVRAQDTMLVAVHPWDIHGAARAGLRTAWINRGGGAYPSYFAAPEVEVRDFQELADRVS